MKLKVIKCECGASFGSVLQANIIKMMEHCIKEHPEEPSVQRQHDSEYNLKMCLLENKWKLMRTAIDKDELGNHENAIMQLPKLRTPYFLKDSTCNSLSRKVVDDSQNALALASSVEEKKNEIEHNDVLPLPNVTIKPEILYQPNAKQSTSSLLPQPIPPKSPPTFKQPTKSPLAPKVQTKTSQDLATSTASFKDSTKSLPTYKEPTELVTMSKELVQLLPSTCAHSRATAITSLKIKPKDVPSVLECESKRKVKNNTTGCRSSCTEHEVPEKLIDKQTRKEIWQKIEQITEKKSGRKKVKMTRVSQRDPELEKICSKIPLKQNKAQSARRKSHEVKYTCEVSTNSEDDCNLLQHTIRQPTVLLKKLSIPYKCTVPVSPKKCCPKNTVSEVDIPSDPSIHISPNKHCSEKFFAMSSISGSNLDVPSNPISLKKRCFKKRAVNLIPGTELDIPTVALPAKKSRRTIKQDLHNLALPKPILNADDFCNFEDDLPDL